jgi:glycosyltransferase involved in cell wall biosynthesis
MNGSLPPANVVLVVPCFNEESRFQADAFESFALANAGFRFVFVDDGSSDSTLAILNHTRERIGARQVSILSLSENSGKAEAVRQGMLFAQSPFSSNSHGSEFIGFVDADLAIPLNEMKWMHDKACHLPVIQAVVANRISLLGRTIERQRSRRVISVSFSLLTQFLFRLGMRETQCGAKLFRNEEWLEQILATPFKDRWLFDIELFVRMKQLFGSDFQKVIYEQPLDQCLDIRDSRLQLKDFILAPARLVNLAIVYSRFGSMSADKSNAGRSIPASHDDKNIPGSAAPTSVESPARKAA